jgi:exodeoxyribonuclease VII small subunit
VSAADPEPVSFDRALAELDRIVARMEQGDVGLEEAVALFEEGQRHLATCRERLAAAQRRIEELTADDLPGGGEEPEAEPF